MGLIFLYYCCVTSVAPTQDPHTHPSNVGRAVQTIHMMCGVPTTCAAHHRCSADDELRRVDGTYGPVASGDSHVPPSVW
jgi:hypothetical protein